VYGAGFLVPFLPMRTEAVDVVHAVVSEGQLLQFARSALDFRVVVACIVLLQSRHSVYEEKNPRSRCI